MFSPGRVVLVVLLCITLVSGCGGGKSSATLATVRGKVTVDGQPLTSGHVTLHPSVGEPAGGGSMSGQISSSGEYTIHTDGREGAPPGNYKITVHPSMVPTGGKEMPKTPFDPKYSDPNTTTLRYQVVTTAAPGTYDLTMTSK
jgi:hypothetical protein